MDILKAKQSEYDELQAILKEIHTEIINKDEDIRKLILELISEDGGCYVKDVTDKLHDLYSKEACLVSDSLLVSYENIEKNLEIFVNTIKSIDKVE